MTACDCQIANACEVDDSPSTCTTERHVLADACIPGDARVEIEQPWDDDALAPAVPREAGKVGRPARLPRGMSAGGRATGAGSC